MNESRHDLPTGREGELTGDQAASREDFYERLNKFPCSKEELASMKSAYELAEKAHEGQMRDAGGRYFEHPRQVAIILMEEANAEKSSLITSALLHDTVEDTDLFGDKEGKSYNEWSEAARQELEKRFGQPVADTVIALTKPSRDDSQFNSREAVRAKHLANLEKELEKGNIDPLIIKMADRLQNLRTLSGLNQKRIERTIKETKDHFLPFFEKGISHLESSADEGDQKKAQWGRILLEKIQAELADLAAES